MPHPFLRRASLAASLLAGLSLGAAPARADTPLTVLHAFSATDVMTGDNADGAAPAAALVALGDGFLYGTASRGGANNTGTIFKVRLDGTGYTVLYTLSAFSGGSSGNYVNSDGALPQAALVAPGDGFLYGAAGYGGPSGTGTLFKVRPDGTGFTVLHAFSADSTGGNADGDEPLAALVAPGDGFLYGTVKYGGANGYGGVFKVRPDGTGFTVLHAFSAAATNTYVNSDGALPQAALVAPGDGFLYGAAGYGGPSGTGTLFKVRPNGTGYTVLHAFSAATSNSDGTNPSAALVAPGDGFLYGTAVAGGMSGAGTVFRLRPDGTSFTALHAFSDADGIQPFASLLVSGDGFLYGTASGGGPNATGTLFKVRPDGTGFTVLYAFSADNYNTHYQNADGAEPQAALMALGDGFLYGTASGGGANGSGTVFRLSGGPVGTSPPPVTLTHLLWNNTDGKAAFWNVDGQGNVTVPGVFGPFANGQNLWHATALATGPDGVSHLLWNNPDGHVALWSVTDSGSVTGTTGFGPYTDGAASNVWSAAGLSVGPDNVIHLLWTNPDRKAAFWNVTQSGSVTGVTGYGPYFDGGGTGNPWIAFGVSTGPDNVSHLLWANTDGKGAFWDLSANGGIAGITGYGPYTDGSASNLWYANAVSTGPDNVSHLLWNNVDAKAAFWNVSSADGSIGGVTGYGPFFDGSSPWHAAALATGPDNVSHLLWNNPDGHAALWLLGASGSASSVFGFGPFTDGSATNLWTAVAVSSGP